MAEATNAHQPRRPPRRPLEGVYRECTNPEDWKWYSNKRWRRLRAAVLLRQPMCTDPFTDHKRRGELTPAEEVHHIKPRKEFPLLAFDINNLEALCRKCHRRLTRLEQTKRTGKIAARDSQEQPGTDQAGPDPDRQGDPSPP